jgi:1-acyl-sn-glycerol-3-phosphate acyltransferase
LRAEAGGQGRRHRQSHSHEYGRAVKRISNVGESPLFRDDGPLGARVFRRVRGITLEIVAFVLVTVLLPVLLLGAAVVDLVLWLKRRKPWVGVRLTAFLWWFLFGEMRALIGLLGIWIVTGAWFGVGSKRRRVLLYRLRVHWCNSHLSGIRVLFGLRFEIEGLDEAAPGPVVVMLRHASIIDNMLPDSIVSRTHGIGLRYVIKRELQMIPTIDIGGRWVPTNFIRRGSGDTEGEIERLLKLTEDLVEGEGILIYPEGTRFTPSKLARAQEIVRERQPEYAELADRLEHLLPPRLGGPLALLEEAPEVDVVFCGHVGFDGFQYISDVWAGELVGSVIGVKFWRVPASEIPKDDSGRAEWLYRNWQEMDDWIASKIQRSNGEQGRFDSE